MTAKTTMTEPNDRRHAGIIALPLLRRPSSPALDRILGTPRLVLDKGFVRVVDYMGNEAAIVQMARVSYGEGTKSKSDDTGLMRYLMRHAHTSPYEGCELKLHLKMPIFVARQWIRHRTASLNEYSGRYSVMRDEFYIPSPDDVAYQSRTNKQGSGEAGEYETARDFASRLETACEAIYARYEGDIYKGLAREQARIGLPLNIYTEFYWKIDLHNLLHFLNLRMDKHAQKEIRDYADAIGEIVQSWLPDVWQAFLEYRLNAVTLSSKAFGALMDSLDNNFGQEFAHRLFDRGVSKGEAREIFDHFFSNSAAEALINLFWEDKK